MKKEEKMIRLSIQLPKEVEDDLSKIAKINGMSKAGVARYLLIKEINELVNNKE